MTPQNRLALIADASLAPSVHNIQAARFRFEDETTITLSADETRRLFVGDPERKDHQKGLGAAYEGLMLTLSARGLGAETISPTRVRIATGANTDPLVPFIRTRASYRGAFAAQNDATRAAVDRLTETCPDLHVIQGRDALTHVADMFDTASMEVLRAPAYRAELLSWMRLSKSHPRYHRDGLNAEHMALSPIEASGAGVVLGPRAFPALDRVGAARPLISEAGKITSAACVALFHRPTDEPEFDTGRRFYRVWLEVERQGLALCPMSVLADVPHVAQQLLNENGLARTRKLVTAFRIGHRPPGYKQPQRVRLPATELILP
jgi:nitroreductase